MIAEPLLIAMLITSSPDGLIPVSDDDCYVPMSQWQPRHKVRAMAEANGWAVRRIKIDDGCYEVYFFDADGVAGEARVNPATLAVIKIEQEDLHGLEDDSSGDSDTKTKKED